MKLSVKSIAVYLLNIILSSILSMLIYGLLSMVIRIIPVDELPLFVSKLLSAILMICIQIISITVLLNILLKRKRYLLEKPESENVFDIMRYFFKYDIDNDKSILVSFCIVFVVNVVSIGLTAVGDKFGGVAGIFFSMFSTRILPMILFGEKLIFNIIGFVLSSFLFIFLYYIVLALMYKKSRNK